MAGAANGARTAPSSLANFCSHRVFVPIPVPILCSQPKPLPLYLFLLFPTFLVCVSEREVLYAL